MANPTSTGPARQKPSLFDQAARIFDGWVEPDTGARVLRVCTRGQSPEDGTCSTLYHQFSCFLDGGRKVLLRRRGSRPDDSCSATLLDLTTGAFENPFPPGCVAKEVRDDTRMASLLRKEGDGRRTILWDMRAEREVASVHTDGWNQNATNFLADGLRAITLHFRGRPYDERVQSRHYLLTPGEPPRLVLEADGYLCSHPQGCPSDLELYAYDRWPSPVKPIDQAIRLRTLDGRHDEAMPMAPDTRRPGDTWGARDHYVWTPDSRRIVSYFCPKPIPIGADFRKPGFNHFAFEWWLSATDWRTGQDLAARYPAGRWGGHMQMTPDSRHIVCGGGPGFDKLFAVDMEGLRNGWNERVLCSYPKTISEGRNSEPFCYPFVLPDQSGVIFNAGWPGPEHGVYLTEWPADLR